MKQSILKQFVSTYRERQVPFHSAALAFYMVIALPAFLVFFLSVAGILLTASTVQSWLTSSGLIGAIALEEIGLQVIRFSSWTAVMSVVIILWTGSAMFHRVQQGLRVMWQIQLNVGSGLKAFVAKKILAIIAALIFIIGIVLLYAGLQTVGVFVNFFGEPYAVVQQLLPIAYLLQVLMLIVVVAIMYVTFGDVRISWQLVLIVSTLVATIIWLLQFAFQAYISTIALVTIYGAAGSVVVLLISLFVLSNVFYSGAVAMFVVAERNKQWTLQPRSYAYRITSASVWDRIKAVFHS